MPRLPPTPAAWWLSSAGVSCLGLSLWLQGRMWLVVFGFAHVAPGGGEYMAALFMGLPALLAAAALLGIAALRGAWRSGLASAGFAASLLLVAAWVVLIVADPR